MKIYVAAVEALRKKERQDETQFTTKIGGKNSFRSQLFRFVKFSFLVKRLIMHYYYVETGSSRPLNCVTLQENSTTLPQTGFCH